MGGGFQDLMETVLTIRAVGIAQCIFGLFSNEKLLAGKKMRGNPSLLITLSSKAMET